MLNSGLAIDATVHRPIGAQGRPAIVEPGTQPDPKLDAEKQALRLDMRALLERTGDASFGAASAAIVDGVRTLDAFASAPSVLAYWPMAKEVDIRGLIAGAIEGGKMVCLPRIDWASGSMEAVRIDRADPPLETLRHGVYEPIGGEVVPPDEVAFIVVPGLAFDDGGARLGRGAGYYDVYAQRAPGAYRCGVCLSAQVIERIPVDRHDARVHAIVTERMRIIV